jgi:hypothetical protein
MPFGKSQDKFFKYFPEIEREDNTQDWITTTIIPPQSISLIIP